MLMQHTSDVRNISLALMLCPTEKCELSVFGLELLAPSY